MIISFRKSVVYMMAAVPFVFLLGLVLILHVSSGGSASVLSKEEWYPVFETLFQKKNRCIQSGQYDELSAIYAIGEQDGRWSRDKEIKRAKYLKNWSEKQGVDMTSIVSHFDIVSVKKVGRGFSFFLIVSTEYRYVYEDMPEQMNMFRIGTYHTLDLIPSETEGRWIFSREWYPDPFYASLNLEKLDTGEIKSYINAQRNKAPVLSDKRKNAVAYADRYAGAAADDEYGYAYNKNYPNFNLAGGDCTNYISQALHEGGGFKRNATWNVTSTAASGAWCNANDFKNYMVYSGRASVIARGKYTQVYKSAYKLLPGDIIAYQGKGAIAHNSFVTDYDSKGYPLVDSHSTDRYHVPWDMGWSDSDITFYLLHVNY